MLTRRNFITTAAASALAAPALAQSGFVIPPEMRRAEVELNTDLTPGDIHLYKESHNLYFIMPGRRAMAYKIGVGELGMQWDGATTIGRKAE
ncbi:ErfK/YbiS/YcfS/YnhG protein [Oceanicola granulosus HTCC2516]|uniref:ErfK/YbiS/YcfS/YnhG protein n=1 Tax=Oceanicola granulosus (strain ATCC BAA-861 / DSM 15982 / KCTC 12143 / HTCC2516) TaxID=314256 RepID=Q2CAG4_OCEGH|nr:ErfK/YbiS/YcfS/YnhG protein [Oceanicola granulosus HTCC2516]